VRVLTLLEYYLPGFKSGGPIRSIANLVEHCGDQIEFFVLTRDHDAGDIEAYPGVKLNSWQQVEKAKVYYATRSHLTPTNIRKLLIELNPDIILLNSLFAPLARTIVWLRRLRLIPQIPMILAPRGELSPGALELKRGKKRVYLALSRRLGLFDGLVWQASSNMEAGEIEQVMGAATKVFVSSNLPEQPKDYSNLQRKDEPKMPGKARLVFLSRISPKKNLLFALQLLPSIQGQVSLDVYGPANEDNYYRICREASQNLPEHIEVRYRGSVTHDQVVETLLGYHFMIFPTLGENFGHVVFEALSAGCPVLLSDQTPWHATIARQIGWDFSHIGWSTPLAERERWTEVLQTCVDMDHETYQAMSSAAGRFAHAWYERVENADQAKKIFMQVFESAG
jgi:glycosyltransferase involved in cell wall biosynthesis